MHRVWTLVIPAAVVGMILLALGALPAVTAAPAAPRPFNLLLKSRQFMPDPGRDPAVVQALKRQPRHTVHALVQFEHDLTASERADLEAAGVTLLDYVPDRTYFTTLDGKVDLAHPALATARWIGAIKPADRLDPNLVAGNFRPWAMTDSGALLVIVRFFADVSPAQAEAILKRAEADVRDSIQSLNSYVAAVPFRGIIALAYQDAVQWIEPAEPALGPAMLELRHRVGSDQLNNPPWNLQGEGVNVLVFDSGLADQNHADLAGRVKWQVRDSNAQAGQHATLVAGTIAGSGALSQGLYQGIAPRVFLYSDDYQPERADLLFYNNPGDIEQAYLNAFYGRATLVNNSLGMNVGYNPPQPCQLLGHYEMTAQLLDRIARGQWRGGQPMTLIWAAGNERAYQCRTENGYRTVAPPATAKNPIVVGAVNLDDGQMTSFSSWGSVKDGRLKPDLVAPGDSNQGGITSTIPSNAYGQYRGTSVAAPVVTGIAALMLERYQRLYPGHTPLPSTLKALLINTAHDQDNVDRYGPRKPGPDYAYGYGEVDGVHAVTAVDDGQFIEGSLDAGLEANVFTMQVTGGQKLQVSLVWDDVPPAPNSAGPDLVNDLDLVLIDPGGAQHEAWVLDPDHPELAAQTGPNHRDNVEQVTINDPMPGTWIVRINPFRIPRGPQPYSLAVTGGRLVPSPRTPMHIANMNLRGRASGGRYQVSTYVTIVNAMGAPVPGAVVEIKTVIPGEGERTVLATTDSNGNAVVRFVSRQPGTYTSSVTRISHATLDRDPSVDVRTTVSLSISR